MRAVLAVHQWLYEVTGGRIGHRLLGVPTLLLTTTGRHSGLVRRAALVYAEHDGQLAVVASAGGAATHPAWFLNLRADPQVIVQRGRSARRHTAAMASETERDEWWRRCNEVNNDRYDEYQRLTDREIPVVVLTPAS